MKECLTFVIESEREHRPKATTCYETNTENQIKLDVGNEQ